MTLLATYPRTKHRPDAPFLAVSHLGLRYNGAFALEDVSFEVLAGERLAVVGPNGAGKSTLFKLIAGILQPTSGSVYLAGSGPGRHICIGYVPQRPQIDWHFPASVADVVMMGRAGKIGLFHRPSRSDWDFVHQSLQTVGMEGYADRQIGELSGGQQQRVFIARTLAQESELVLMDEPLTGLDLTTQQDILGILAQLQSQGVTVMVATHDLNRAASDYDRVLLVNRRLLGIGAAADVLTARNLVSAYGEHLHMIETDAGVVAIGDTHCDGDC